LIHTRRYVAYRRNELMASRNQNGFSLLEMMITLSIALILIAVTFVTLQPALNQNHVNTAYDTTLMALRTTRNLAIAQSNQYYVNFNPAAFPAGTIQVEVQPFNSAGVAQPIQQVITYSIPTDVSFATQGTFPATAPDSPPPLVTAGGALDFESTPGVALTPAGGGGGYVVFYPDGSARDNLGNYVNGIAYITRLGSPIWGSKAISVWGATGRIRGWSLNDPGGVATWVQQ
jgi:prepilin-type N-terminal cleavage/methylation domain-containing protein